MDATRPGRRRLRSERKADARSHALHRLPATAAGPVSLAPREDPPNADGKGRHPRSPRLTAHGSVRERTIDRSLAHQRHAECKPIHIRAGHPSDHRGLADSTSSHSAHPDRPSHITGVSSIRLYLWKSQRDTPVHHKILRPLQAIRSACVNSPFLIYLANPSGRRSEKQETMGCMQIRTPRPGLEAGLHVALAERVGSAPPASALCSPCAPGTTSG